jgi:anti-sigma regulatory factor (Ser/Thr protein kinase)
MKTLTIETIHNVLELAVKYQIGVSFTPTPEGWEIGFLDEGRGGDVAIGPDLETALAEAMPNLLELGEAHEHLRDHLPGDEHFPASEK